MMFSGTREHRNASRRGAGGFALVEALVASGLSLLLMSGAVMLLAHHLRLARAHPAAVDLPERARLLADHLISAFLPIGSGALLDDGQRGPRCCVPLVVPRRIGLHGAGRPDEARDDMVSVAVVPTGVVGRMASTFPGGISTLHLSAGCGVVGCGLVERQDVLLFDGTGRHDYFRVASADVDIVLAPRQPGLGGVYAPGSYLVPVDTHTYYFDPDARQIRRYDGYVSDIPIVDDVAAFRVAYWGEDQWPAGPETPAGTANCIYAEDGSRQPWPTPIGSTSDLVPLDLAVFTDGPWCGVGENRFDADLLRIRRVGFTVTLEASDDLRASGAMFSRPGRSRASLSIVSDLTFTFDVTPRGLNAGR